MVGLGLSSVGGPGDTANTMRRPWRRTYSELDGSVSVQGSSGFPPSGGVRGGSTALSATIALLLALLGSCSGDELSSDQSGTLRGQVIVSGPLSGATVSVEQLDLETGDVYARVAETVDITTDGDGKFSMETGLANGLLRITARGGAFTDLATGATIQLDATDELSSLTWFELLETAEDVLVSPVGHLVDARMRAHLAGSTAKNETEHAAELLHKHFGNVDWMRLRLVGLDEFDPKPTSPTVEVRAALVQAAFSFLAKEIAADANAGAQEINVYQLTRRWADDIAGGPFDGNDGNSRAITPDSIQLGSCPPVDMPCPMPSTGCTDGFCRRLCDLYVGTPRALLGGMMTRVIRDNGPGGVNQTGLDINNTLAIARSISDNVEPELFGEACIETLDRIAPIVTFQAPSAEAMFIRGALLVRVVAVDDTDVPRAKVEDHEDTDGDPTNAVAQATIDTTKLPGGTLQIRASASDLSGNIGTATRVVTVDNAAPMLKLDDAGFLKDGPMPTDTWWTQTRTPMLSGDVADDAPVTVDLIVAGGVTVPAIVSGNRWTALLAMSHLEDTGTQVTIVATDAAGNQKIASQRIRPDADAPKLSLAASTVIDEATDTVDFSNTPGTPGSDAIPRHMHAGALKNLDAVAPMCPSFTKHSYLLASAPPAYGVETPSRNPIQYQLLVEDVGVGIVDGSIEYRVGRGIGPTTNWILDWTDVGPGVQVGSGLQQFAVGIFSDVVAGLAATEGLYSVEFRARDRLNRETPLSNRCFDLRIKAAPLKFEPGGPPLPNPAQSHVLALDSLNLAPGSPFDQIAARLLNNGAHASILEQPIIHGTDETVFLTVMVVKPTAVTAAKNFTLRTAASNHVVVNVNCSLGQSGCESPPPLNAVNLGSSTTISTLQFPVRLFRVDVAGNTIGELSCIQPCPPTGDTFRFELPPRPGGNQAPQRFKTMTMIGQVPELWPTNTGTPAPPYVDGFIAGVEFTGLIGVNVQACSQFRGFTNSEGEFVVTGCNQRATFTGYRALTSASLQFASTTTNTFATAPALQLPPLPTGPQPFRSAGLGWSTTEGALP